MSIENLLYDLSTGTNALGRAITFKNPAPIVEFLTRKSFSSGLDKYKKKHPGISEADLNFLRGLSKTGSIKSELIRDALNINPPLSICLKCLQALFNDNFLIWEPETISMELSDIGVEVTDLLMDKVGAIVNLCVQPNFLWDNRVFENTCIVANDIELEANIVQELDIPQLCWGSHEGMLILKKEQPETANLEFDREIVDYTGIALFLNHYLLAPKELAFAQEKLDELNSNSEASSVIQDRFDSFMEKYRKNPTTELIASLDENIVDVQIRKLLGCQLYMAEKLAIVDTIQNKLEL